MIYFDNAATTMQKPKQVIDAVTEAMCSLGNAGRGAYDASLQASRTIFEARQNLADFFHAEGASQVVFTSNSTESLNIAIKGVLCPGDHVITTALEHNSVLRPLYEMEERGVELTIIDCDEEGRIYIEDMERAIRENTKAIVCTHGSNLTGNLIDIGSVGRLAHSHGVLLIVDASQTAGVFPIDVQQMHIDILCFTGHKSLLGPQGTGGMVVRKGVKVRPLKSGGSGIQSYRKRHPEQMPTALEAGTLNGHGLAGLNAAVHYIRERGMDAIREREIALADSFYQGIREIPGVKIYGDFRSANRCPIVTLNIREHDSAEISDALCMEYGIAVRPGAHCAPLMHEALGIVKQGAVRFSFSCFNTEDEIAAGIEAVRELAAEA